MSGQSTAQVVAAIPRDHRGERRSLIATFADGDAPCRTKQLHDLLVNMGGRGVIREVLLHPSKRPALRGGRRTSSASRSTAPSASSFSPTQPESVVEKRVDGS